MAVEPTKPEAEHESAPAGFTLRDALWIVVATLIAVAALAAGWILAGHRESTAPTKEESRKLAAFSLQERSGRTVTDNELSGQFLVVNFVFTSCSVSCLQVNHHMAEIQRLTASQPDVRLVSITLDPRTDTAPVLSRFADRFDADTNRWLFLTGNKEQVYALLKASFLTRSTNDPANLTPGGFVGMERIILVDPQGNSRASFNGLRDDAPDAVAGLIAELRKGGAAR